VTDKRIYLKVKARSLAEESRIIRRQEAIQKHRAAWAKAHEAPEEEREARALWDGLSEHRRIVVRREARSTQLAYAFIRGKAYRDIEAYSHEQPNWTNVKRLVQRYGEFDAATFDAWTAVPERPRPVRAGAMPL
jgi:hypothetical protein